LLSESKMEMVASQVSSENSKVQQNSSKVQQNSSNSNSNSSNSHKPASGITFQATASPDRRSNISAPVLCSPPNFGAAQTSENDNANNDGDDEDDQDDFVDLSGLFKLLQQKNWHHVLEFLLKYPNASRQTIHCQGGVTFLLHIVLRHGPPAAVVDLVVAQDQGSAAKGSIWKQTDTKGRLPLHAACSCGPESYPEVITKVIRADPDALRMRTENSDARLPLHLAVVTGASERVVQQLLIHYPYAAFVTDGHGKIALDYAEDSCYGHNRLVVALELAPMLLDTAQAAEHHCVTVQGNHLAALREEHAVSQEQLRARSARETRRLLDQQVRCNQDLADEKARNHVLARTLVEARESYRGLLKDRANLRQRLERERIVGKTRAQSRDDELKRILLLGGRKTDGDDGEVKHATDDEDGDEVVGTDESARADKGGAKGEGDHEGGSTKAEIDDGDDEDDDDDEEEEASRKRSHSSLAKISLPALLKRISSGYEASKRRNRSYKEQMDRQRETVKNLNLLLTAKEEELAQVQKTSRTHERAIAAANDRVDQLGVLHREAVSKLAKARDEAEKWKRINEENTRDLDQALRRLKFQEKRVSGFRALLLSMGSSNEPAKPETSPYRERAESSSSIVTSKEVEVELQVGATAVTDAPNDDHDDCGTSVADSRDEALSVELAVASAIGNFSNASDCGTIETVKAESSTPQIGIETPLPKPMPTAIATATEAAHPEFNPSEAVTPIRKLTQKADKNDTKWIRGTPQTLSISTETTMGSSEEADGQGAVKLFPPQTPPVPGHVGGRREQHGGCSPLASPRLELP